MLRQAIAFVDKHLFRFRQNIVVAKDLVQSLDDGITFLELFCRGCH